MKPHILGRALSLVRAPEGVGGETFFQKHIASTVKSSPLRHVVPGKDHDVIAVETVDDLVALVQSGALGNLVRGSRLDSLETCDRIVFDLDPGEGVEWKAIVAAAREIRERLNAIKLASFVKLSGGKGIHVVLPITDADWDTAKLFAQRIAAAMAADSPKLYLAKMTKSLRKGRIFIDHFRNSREATSIAAYSTRARAGAPVSAPVTWERLARTTGGNDFSVLDLKKRLKEDAWTEIGKVRQSFRKFARDAANRARLARLAAREAAFVGAHPPVECAKRLTDDNVVLMTVEDGRNGRRLRFGNRGHFFDDHALSLALSARPAGGRSNHPQGHDALRVDAKLRRFERYLEPRVEQRTPLQKGKKRTSSRTFSARGDLSNTFLPRLRLVRPRLALWMKRVTNLSGELETLDLWLEA